MLDVLGSAEDRNAFRRLLASADVLIESYDPGEMSAVGLGYDDLASEFPQLIYSSVSAYGQDGPLAKRPATELNSTPASRLGISWVRPSPRVSTSASSVAPP